MVTSEPVNDKTSVSSNLCLTGNRYFEVYMRTKTIGDLYLPISYYK
ncbi:MAG: hypothetical protein NT129_04355 [Candidatus Aenigmarchaeota archaeon]|nr:hypothetical protein [Candidatus Aenigmarchaeota archaeon]